MLDTRLKERRHGVPADSALTRRQFCTGACQAACGGALAALLAGCGGSSPTSPSSRGSGMPATLAVVTGQFGGNAVRVTAGPPLAEAGGAVLVESIAGVFLLARTGADTFTALDAICTHQSCTITGQDGMTFVCPCHGSRYDRSGRVIGGPAPAALRQYATSFDAGVVSIAL